MKDRPHYPANTIGPSAFLTGLSLFLLVIVVSPACSKQDPQQKAEQNPTSVPKKIIQPCTLAGTWYPAEPEELNKQLSEYLSRADITPQNDVMALILPHAGYQYSAQTAAYGIKSLKRQYSRIVVIGPSHHIGMRQIFSVPTVTHFQTPLGEIPLDTEWIDQLVKHPMFRPIPQAHDPEHSVQIELPLLQMSQKDFRLVPIVAGMCSYDTIQQAAATLAGLLDSNTLVVISSDFVHYGPNYDFVPFRDDLAQNIRKLDMQAFGYISTLDGQGFLDFREKSGATICGAVPIALLLSMAPKGTPVKLLNYSTSGELMKDYTNSVSYMAVAFSGTWPLARKVDSLSANRPLTAEDKQKLLTLARKTLIYTLENQPVAAPSDLGIEMNPTLEQVRAAFVTIKKESNLRGCIGDIFPRQPLYQSVMSNAINAAIRDPRFLPVTRSELNTLSIEISALTEPSPVASAQEIRIGTDGVVLRKNGRSAVFLPQVAPEQGWNLDQMLSQLSLKAGLPKDAWQQDAEFLVFQAEVFGEEK